MIALATTKIGINPYTRNSMSSSNKSPQFKIGRNVGNTNQRASEGTPRFTIGSNVGSRRYAARQPIQTSVQPSAFEKFGNSLGEVLWGSSQLASGVLSSVADNFNYDKSGMDAVDDITSTNIEYFIDDDVFLRAGMYVDISDEL